MASFLSSKNSKKKKMWNLLIFKTDKKTKREKEIKPKPDSVDNVSINEMFIYKWYLKNLNNLFKLLWQL